MSVEPAPAPAPEPAPAPAPAPVAAAPDPAPAPAPAPDPAPVADKTLAGSDPAPAPAPKPGDPPAAVVTDWRTKLAGDDKAFLTTLNRYASEADFGKAHRALQQKLSSGEVRKVLPDNATPEQLAAYRKDEGVPDKWEAYDIKLANGMVPGDGDKPVLDLFKQFAHGKNMSPALLNDIATWHFETQDALASMRADEDAKFQAKAEDELRIEYGPDYRRNMNVLGTVRDGMPQGLFDRVFAGRTADGKVIGNDPAVVRWMVGLGLEINPAATLIPAGQGDPGKGVDARLAEIRAARRENPDKYDQDKAVQAEELELLNAQARLQARGKAA